jgi:hypothetical protein
MTQRLFLFLGLAAAAEMQAHAALPHALDGSWYNPQQSGHGLTLERVDHDSALLFWHVFDPQGRPLTLYIETRVEGNRIVGEALAPEGMRFGNLDTDPLALPYWGQIQIEFSDCAHGTLRYDSPLPGFGQGEILLTRLVAPKDPACSLADPAGLAGMAGYSADANLYGNYSTGVSTLDEYDEGRIYYDHASGWVTSEGGLAFVSHPNYGAEGDDFVIIGQPLPAAGGEARLAMQVWSAGWLDPILHPGGAGARPARRDGFPLQLRTYPAKAKGVLFPRRSGPGAPEGEITVTHPSAFARALRPGRYPFLERYVGSPQPTFELEVSASLALCVRRTFDFGEQQPCLFTGQATLRAADFAFLLEGPGGTFRGAGQAEYCDVPLPVCDNYFFMAGDNGVTGLRIQSATYGIRPQ